MQSSLFKGAIVGAIIAFIWSAISWMAIPWHKATVNRFHNEQAIVDTMMTAAPKDGIYIFPYGFECNSKGACSSEGGQKQMGASTVKQPMIFASVSHREMKMCAGSFIMSFIIYFISAVLIAWLLLQTKSTIFWHKTLFVTIVGLTAGIMTYLPLLSWWSYPAGYVWVHIADLTITWFLAGLAMAKLVRK